MKIADFFISLGFKIDGSEDVAKVDKNVERLEHNSLKLLAGVTALNAAFYSMMTLAVEAGIGLQKFAVNTGLSSEQLQVWMNRAERANVSGKEVVTAIEAIQHARAAIAFGNAEAAAPWMLLGIDPRQDPFKVLEQLRKAVLNLDPAIARQKLSEMGFGENMFYFLKQVGSAGLNKDFIVSKEQSDRLAALGAQWKAFLFTLAQVGTRFASEFAEPIGAVLEQLTHFLALAGKFVSWLEKGGTGADVFKYAVLGIITVLAGLNIAIGALLAGPIGMFAALLGIIAVAIGGLVLLLQDFVVAAEGGKSFFDWNKGLLLTIDNVNRLASAIEWVIEKWGQLKGLAGSAAGLGADLLSAQTGNVAPLLGRIMPGGGSTISQTNNNTVHVNGAGNPAAVGREVGRSVNRQVSDSFAQMPLPSR